MPLTYTCLVDKSMTRDYKANVSVAFEHAKCMLQPARFMQAHVGLFVLYFRYVYI